MIHERMNQERNKQVIRKANPVTHENKGKKAKKIQSIKKGRKAK